MADTLTPIERSARMARIRGRDTKPEMAIRLGLHRLGYRYRLHCKELPGRPDIVFPSRRKVIFVHGCFWHNHNCSVGHIPASRKDYWAAKFARNTERDAENLRRLTDMGWTSLIIWECEIKTLGDALKDAVAFLEENTPTHAK